MIFLEAMKKEKKKNLKRSSNYKKIKKKQAAKGNIVLTVDVHV